MPPSLSNFIRGAIPIINRGRRLAAVEARVENPVKLAIKLVISRKKVCFPLIRRNNNHACSLARAGELWLAGFLGEL